MASHGTYSPSHINSQPGYSASRQGFGAGHMYGSTTSHPRCYEPSSYANYGGHGALGGYGTCGGPSSYGGLVAFGGPGGSAYGSPSYGGPGGPGGPGGYGGYATWFTPRPNCPPQWGYSWGN